MVVEAPRRSYGSADHGRAMSLKTFLAANWEEGFKYELIDGKVYVSPKANLPHDRINLWLSDEVYETRILPGFSLVVDPFHKG